MDKHLSALMAVALGLTGCMSPKVTKQVTQAVESANPWAKPSPATTLICCWQPRLSVLPDPTRDGTQSPGLPGQIYLITPDKNTAEVTGDITVAVYDDTPRPPGMEPKKPEVWHFDRETVKRLATTDERFGRCYALFIPWRPDWRDVTVVRILTRYDPPGQPTLQSGEVRLALDTADGGTPVWSEVKGAAGGRNVPDGAKVLQQVQATQVQK